MIWLRYYELPRILELGSLPGGPADEERHPLWATSNNLDIWQQVRRLTTKTRTHFVSPGLKTCFLSREIGLAYYAQNDFGCPFYFNPYRDILYFGKYSTPFVVWDMVDLDVTTTEICNYAFNIDAWNDSDCFAYFSHLAPERHHKKIILVLESDIATVKAAGLGPAGASEGFYNANHGGISANRSLRAVGKLFRDTEKTILSNSWNDFNTWMAPYSADLKTDAVWRMPKITFMLDTNYDRQRQPLPVDRVKIFLPLIPFLLLIICLSLGLGIFYTKSDSFELS